jgi:hypothetical protein
MHLSVLAASTHQIISVVHAEPPVITARAPNAACAPDIAHTDTAVVRHASNQVPRHTLDASHPVCMHLCPF